MDIDISRFESAAPVDYRSVVRIHSWFRLLSTLPIVVAAVILATIWMSAAPLGVAAAAGVIAVHAGRQLRQPATDPLRTLLLDGAALVVAILLVDPPRLAALAVLLSTLIAAALFLPSRYAIPYLMGTTAATAVATALAQRLPTPSWTPLQVAAITWLVSSAFLFLVVALILGTGRTVRDRYDLMERLSVSEQRHRQLFKRNPAALVVYDEANQTIREANAAAADLYGRPVEELVGRPVGELFVAADYGEYLDRQASELPGSLAFHRYRHRRADGSSFTADLRDQPLLVEGRRARLMLVLDATPEEQAVAQSRRVEAQYLSLAGLSPLGLTVQRDGMLLFANETWSALVGAASPEMLRGRRFLDFVDPPARPGVTSRLAAAQSGRAAPDTWETRLRTEHGDLVPVECTAVPITYGGEPALQVGMRVSGDRSAPSPASRLGGERQA